MSVPAPVSDSKTSSGLLARAKEHDPAAIKMLLRWIGPFILRWCRQAGLQEADFDEVFQDVHVKILEHLDQFSKKKPGDSFRAWVYTIIKHCICDLRRRISPDPLPADLAADFGPGEEKDWTDRANQLLLERVHAIHANDPGYQAFYETTANGRSATEVAADLGMSLNQVSQHKRRWLTYCRTELGELFGNLLP